MSVLVGKKAPDFSAMAVVNGGDFEENFTLSQFKGEKYVVLFFYPLDFTGICNSEVVAFQERVADFEARGAQLIGVSVDSHYSHQAWTQASVDEGGTGPISYPLISDFGKTIAKNYDVLAGDYDYTLNEDGEEELIFEGAPFAYRGLFIIDKEGIVRHQSVNDIPLGRNVAEALRMLDAVRNLKENGQGCPANWTPQTA